MALLFMDGFEGYSSSSDLALFNSSNSTRYSSFSSLSNMSINSTTYRTTQPTAGNSRSLYMSYSIGNDPHGVVSYPNSAEIIVGFGLRFNTAANTICFAKIAGTGPTTTQGVAFGYNSSTGQITANIPNSLGLSTTLGTATGSYSLGVWYFIEIRVKVGNPSGEVQIRINGSDVLNLTGVNTATGSLTAYQSFLFRADYPDLTWFMDDLYICDTTGTVNNTFLGPISVYALSPVANGSSTQLTPTGAASNWEAVDEASRDTTTYVETNTTGHKDYYGFEALPAGVTTINGVAVKAINTTIDNGGRKVKLNIKNGANTIGTATARILSLGSWLYDYFLSETAPDGSAWTKASVESSEAGVEAAE